MQPAIWVEQCQAARRIAEEHGAARALDYLVGKKFLNFLAAADGHAEFRRQVPAFAAEVKALFDPWQLAGYLERARQNGPFDPGLYADEHPEVVELEWQADIRRRAADLPLVERAREWLLGEGGG